VSPKGGRIRSPHRAVEAWSLEEGVVLLVVTVGRGNTWSDIAASYHSHSQPLC